MPPGRVEIEAKLRVPEVGELERLPDLLESIAERWSSYGTSHVVDVYLDTDNWDIYRAGYAFRRRESDDGVTFTLKALAAPATDGVAEREEIEALSEDGAVPEGIRERLAEWNIAEVRECFVVEQYRSKYEVTIPEGRYEASADQVYFSDGSEVCEVEVELLDGAPRGVKLIAGAIRSSTGWKPATESKFQQGLQRSGIPLPE